MNGGAGDDTLIGGQGDVLNGGTGADTFILSPDCGAVIEDYDPAEDVIEIMYEGGLPVLTTLVDGDSLTLLADGEIVAIFDGLTTLELDKISLMPA